MAVDVVVGVVLSEDRFLVEQRNLDDDVDPGIVCLPGGHVRVGEGLGEALRREMWEELGIDLKAFRFVCNNFYVASNGEKQNAYCFLITDFQGRLICKTAQEIFWEADLERLSLDVDRKTIIKVRMIILDE